MHHRWGWTILPLKVQSLCDLSTGTSQKCEQVQMGTLSYRYYAPAPGAELGVGKEVHKPTGPASLSAALGTLCSWEAGIAWVRSAIVAGPGCDT